MNEIIAIAIITLLAVISPGADFALVAEIVIYMGVNKGSIPHMVLLVLYGYTLAIVY